MMRFISAILPTIIWSTTAELTLAAAQQQINKTRAIIIVSDDKTWISFNDAPLVEIDDALHPLSVEDAYNNYTLHYNDDGSTRKNQVQPFSFLSNYVDPLCVVNGEAFRASVHGSFNISCSPPAVNTDEYSLDWTADSSSSRTCVEKDHHPLPPKDLLLQPNHGPQSGGTKVKVSGIITNETLSSGNQILPLCRFENDSFPAIEVNWNEGYAICVSPPSQSIGFASSIKVDISMSGDVRSFTDIGVIFQYDADIMIKSLHPASGPVTGGTLVKVHGGPFQNRDEIICRFGEQDVKATYHDVNEVSCVSPLYGWVDEVQRVSVFSMANSPEIQTITATVDDHNEVHTCQTFGEDVSDDEFGRGFRLVAPGGSIEYPLTRHTRWLHFNESVEGMEDALSGLLPDGFHVNRTTTSSSTFKWEIVLPKTFTYGGETLHVVDTGGGSVKLEGIYASVSCSLSQMGTQRLGGHFRLSFFDDGIVEETSPIPYNSTNEEMKAILEALNGIDTVIVDSSVVHDSNNEGSANGEAFQWHVTFDSLKNSGDIPMLIADTSSLEGSNASINIVESKKGASHAVSKVDISTNYTSFRIVIDGVEGDELMVGASAEDVMESINNIGRGSIVVEKYRSEYYFLDIMGDSLENDLQVNVIYCDDGNESQVCTSELQSVITHVADTAITLGGNFSLQYPSKGDSCRTCRHSTHRISVFATAREIEAALEELSLVSDVDVTITESSLVGRYKVPIRSGIVGANRNFYVHFVQQKLFPSIHDDDMISASTYFAGDLPQLVINRDNVTGTPAKDSAFSEEYNALVTEIVKGSDLNHGGSVELSLSINGGTDFSKRNIHFDYAPIPIVRDVSLAHGSTDGGTKIKVTGDNLSKSSAQSCLFWSGDVSAVNRTSAGFLESSPVMSYGMGEVTCLVPPAMEAQVVSVSIIGSEGITQWVHSRYKKKAGAFYYHNPIEITHVTPNSAETTGGTDIMIHGGPFFLDERLSCMFGAKIVPALFVNPRKVRCTTPQHAAGFYSVSVTQNGQDYEEFRSSFHFHNRLRVDSIDPVSGPSRTAGTNVRVFGENFVNSTSLLCRFGSVVVPAIFRHSSEIHCLSPPINDSELSWIDLPNQRHNNSFTDDNELFPLSHFHPQYLGKLVTFEVTNNGHDFTSAGFSFLYQKDIQVHDLSRDEGPSSGRTPVFITGSHFVNNTQLSCQFGQRSTTAYFLTRDAVLCFSPLIIGSGYRSTQAKKTVPLFVSNNAVDLDHGGHYTYSSSIAQGTYQAGAEGDDTLLTCPRGTYCPSRATNFTLCTPGTYQPSMGQSSCISCPIGYVCSEFGMTVPRICAAGYVCDEKGMAKAKPCPAGYWCDRGTSTMEGACMSSDPSFSSLNTCIDNSTDDFGLQVSDYPASIWAERHLMPLDDDADILPTRGRFCLDSSCLVFNDVDTFEVFDESFDYSSTGFALKRPKLCNEGTYCGPGTSTNITSSLPSSPTTCSDGVHCPAGAEDKRGVGSCKVGYYCRFGVAKPCPVATYCPHADVIDPLPCEPGQFNAMVGQTECSTCPIGTYCPRYGLRDPLPCDPGYVCSNVGLTRPNLLCPAGFYCQNFTKTSDPFRNDTTLRPYACSPGTFCYVGTGSNMIQEGVLGFAQPCSPGFFCEAASTSPKGSGACPPGFVCPKGTAVPRPTQKGSFAEHPGLKEATACLPGFYAPTIENRQCYECPPGTSCDVEGLFHAEECPPGTYRSTNDEDGYDCIPCSQGTWSKNWQLREKGECVRCPPGTVCPLEGMTTPCSLSDLPQPYEPIVNFKGIPALEYNFPISARPPPFTIDECLSLNTDNKHHFRDHKFFYGELIPPYIDILGRGPHFRPSDTHSLKYQSVAKCYKNAQPLGSHVYQRMASYYGPQFDIQTGYPHQGYGSSLLKTQIFAVAPPEGFDFSLRYGYFRGEGNGYIDLPKARIYDSNFNCTKGIQLMNSTLVKDDFRQVVYTDAAHDYEGGYDVEKCGFYDQDLDCYIDKTFQLHAEGECCNIDTFHERAIYLAHDQFYPGTCEADLICAEGGTAAPEAKACDNGFVCDEKTSLDEGRKYPCAAGYVCDVATTPDTKLHAPSNQLNQLCREGFYCEAGTGTKDKFKPCPENYYCPTGTANPILGTLADDGMLRLLDGERGSTSSTDALYVGGDRFALMSSHNTKCKASTQPSLQQRFKTTVKDIQNKNSIEYLDGKERIPTAVAEATQFEETCARDDKSYYVEEAMRRKECDCHSLFFTLATVYRFWKCTSESPLDDLGLADASVPSLGKGKRDFWYPKSRIHLDQDLAIKMDPSMQPYGLNYGQSQTCTFMDSSNLISLVEGRIPYESNEQVDYSSGISYQFTSGNFTAFGTYSDLKQQVREEYAKEHEQLQAGLRDNIDPFVFDLHKSIQLIEQYGQRLEDLVYLQATNETSLKSIEVFDSQSNTTTPNLFEFTGPMDWCECQNLLKCPNGTVTNGRGATSVDECISTKVDVLQRISLLPPIALSNTTSPPTLKGTIDDSPSLHLEPYDVAILTIDQSMLPNNLTYGEHYRISVYDGCKPCPLRYQCSAETSSCHDPSVPEQYGHLNQCLKDNRKMVCLLTDGTPEDVEKCQQLLNEIDASSKNPQVLLFSEPDIQTCLSRPYFCSHSEWNYLTFRRLCQDSLPNGELSAVYDCVDVHRWEVYSLWRDEICCSSVPELRGIDSCDEVRKVCRSNSLIEDIIRDKLIGIFEMEYGYVPPVEQPLGHLLMNTTMQENRDHDNPFELFNTESLSKAGQNQPWIQNEGCCECRSHQMPQFFHSSHNVSGYPDDKHQPIQITISALETVDVSIVIELIHGRYYAEFNDYFGTRDKSSVRIHHPKRFIDESIGGMWLSIVEESTFDHLNLDLPLNLPFTTESDSKNRFLLDRPSNHSIGHPDFKSLGDVTASSATTVDPFNLVSRDGSSIQDFIALPYLPFLSNCDGYDSHVSLSRLLEEHPDCQTVDLDQTVPTREYSFWGKDPISDACLGIILNCTYEEKVAETRKNLRWFEAPPKSKLFYITRDPVSAKDFSPESGNEKWGRTKALDSLRNSYDAIPVSVDKDFAGHRHAIPKNVELELKYYQVTKERKRLVEANVFFSDLCTTQAPRQFGGSHEILDMMNERGILPCDVDINGEIKSQSYNLELHYKPLPWFDLLNRFEFSQGIYFVFYTLIAMVICSIGGFVYGANRIMTKLRHPPQFMGMSLLQLISRPQLEGLLYAIIPYMAVILTIHSWFSDSSSWFEGVRGAWSNNSKIDAKTEMNNAMSRLGSALVVLGFFTIYRTTQVLIPKLPSGSANNGQSEGHLTSKRSHFLWTCLAIEAILMCVWEFSYSETFKNNLFRFKVLFQMMQVLLDLLLSSIMGDRLLAAPILVSIQMAEMLITCGAHNFVDFTLVFLVEVALNVFQRLLLYPLIKTITVLWPRWKILVSRAINNRGLTIQAKKQRELEFQRVNEEIELRTEGIEPLLDSLSIYSMEKTGGMLLPFMCLLLILLYRETEMASQYNINQHDLLYYCLFAFYMIPWMSIVDSLVLSSQELLYGWRMHDYLSFQQWRFANRANMWNLLSQKDDSVTISLQNMDLLCFSSQYYFILTLISIGFGTNMLGLTICLRKKYNFLADPLFPLIVVIVILWSELIARVCIFISSNKLDFICWNGIWRVAEGKGVMDDVIAAKLAIGEGRQEDLEEERRDLMALNNDSFRRKFIDKNRPWILQHLVQLITPGSLQSTGPDDRPLVDYIRDVYSDLQIVGEGARRPGDNADISSDDSSDDEYEMRRQWNRTPLDGSRLLIAQIWLQKARKRALFTSSVSGIIDKRKDDHCHSCFQTYDSLTAGLSWEGEYSTSAIDNLIHLFEDSYGPEECSPDLWKAFFRKHALFYTICNDCSKIKAAHTSNRGSAIHNTTRSISSDSDEETNSDSQSDEDDDAVMDMIIFDPDTTEGTMLSRWLGAARDKLGDSYPRGSIESTQLYLEQMRKKSDRRARKSNLKELAEVDISDKARQILLNWLNQSRSECRGR